MDFCLRLDLGPGTTIQEANAFFDRYCDSYLVVREHVDGGNPHLHALISTRHNSQALRAALNRKGWTGNQCYSIKAVDPSQVDRFHRYLCKGDGPDSPPDVIQMVGFGWDDAWVEQQHEAYWDENADYQKKYAKMPKIIPYVVKKCRDLGLRAYEREKVAEQIIYYHTLYEKPLSIYHARSVCTTVCMSLGGYEDQISLVAQVIAELK
ncbi:MAG: putative replicase [Cressdnaviricota sp.]|nr:MAG: putative replicase [Cressdnaviricota sp.]